VDFATLDRRKMDASETFSDAHQAGDDVHHQPRIGGPGGVAIDMGAVLKERLEIVKLQTQGPRKLGIEQDLPGLVADGVDKFRECAPAGHLEPEIREEHTQDEGVDFLQKGAEVRVDRVEEKGSNRGKRESWHCWATIKSQAHLQAAV